MAPKAFQGQAQTFTIIKRWHHRPRRWLLSPFSLSAEFSQPTMKHPRPPRLSKAKPAFFCIPPSRKPSKGLQRESNNPPTRAASETNLTPDLVGGENFQAEPHDCLRPSRNLQDYPKAPRFLRWPPRLSQISKMSPRMCNMYLNPQSQIRTLFQMPPSKDQHKLRAATEYSDDACMYCIQNV